MEEYVETIIEDTEESEIIEFYEDSDESLKIFENVLNEADPTVPEHVKAITKEDIARWNEGGTGVAELLTPITYEELKKLRDNAQLVDGMFYRITDYITTTTQEATQSANHQFDIIVRALDENTLDEEAKAIQSEGDQYFANSNLTGWQLWYTLDNDTSRFMWADEVNGKGVIYRLIDENGNDIPYDFKNIQMLDSNNSEDTTYYYTFDSNGLDHSLDGSL